MKLLKSMVADPLKIAVYLMGIHVVFVFSYEPTHLQDIFCRSDFVIMARVQKETMGKCKCSYKIDVLERFKQSCKSEVALAKKVIVGAKTSNGAYCEELKMGHDYILAGNVKRGLAHVHPDIAPIQASDLTDFQEDALRGIYGYNCRCEVLVYPLKTLPKNGLKFCLWSTHNQVLYHDDCQMKYSACTFDKKKRVCMWRNDAAFSKCKGNATLVQASSLMSYLKKLNPFQLQKYIAGRKSISLSERTENTEFKPELQIHTKLQHRIFTDSEDDYTGQNKREWK